MEKKRFVLVGTGARGISAYIKPLFGDKYRDVLEVSGLFDAVRERAEVCSREYGNIPVFTDFEEMLNTVKPDYIVVTTKDADHHKYIIRALDMGYDVITEKPITNTREKALAIMEAEKRSGHHVRVIFNMRYMKPIEDLKRVVASGVIGEVKHIDLHWLLDRNHGASYFRRWHRYLQNSTSLLVHKATHHFDVVNWVTDKKPASVFARGFLEFYGKNGPYRGKSCSSCAHASECPFFYDIMKDDFSKRYFYDLEDVSGYCRDGCVFAEDIDIFDRMALNVLFEDGATMNYALTCYNPDEGMRIYLTGTKGRVEMEYYSSGPRKNNPILIRSIGLDGKEEIVETSFGHGTHGGADATMLETLFGLSHDPDPLGRIAGSYDGYLSLAIGDMAVQSIQSGHEVGIDEFVSC